MRETNILLRMCFSTEPRNTFIYLSTHYKNFVSLEINASLRVVNSSSKVYPKLQSDFSPIP